MINLGQIGAGIWGQNLLRNFFNARDCTVKICCDRNKSALEIIRRNYHDNIKLTDSFDALLKESNLDAVVVATLPATHAHFAIKALSKGKHVFVEKPLALKLEDAKEMLRVAKRKKRILMVGHLLLYHPAIQKLKTYIREGALGDIQYIYSARVNLGQVRAEENALWSLTSHDISVAMYFTENKPYQVQATGKSYI